MLQLSLFRTSSVCLSTSTLLLGAFALLNEAFCDELLLPAGARRECLSSWESASEELCEDFVEEEGS